MAHEPEWDREARITLTSLHSSRGEGKNLYLLIPFRTAHKVCSLCKTALRPEQSTGPLVITLPPDTLLHALDLSGRGRADHEHHVSAQRLRCGRDACAGSNICRVLKAEQQRGQEPGRPNGQRGQGALLSRQARACPPTHFPSPFTFPPQLTENSASAPAPDCMTTSPKAPHRELCLCTGSRLHDHPSPRTPPLRRLQTAPPPP